MAPKKKDKVQTMSLGDFLLDESHGPVRGSWADEVENTIGTQALPQLERSRPSATSWGGGGGGGNRDDRGAGYSRSSESFPTKLPDRPPYTAHLGNLSYDATEDTLRDFFQGCSVATIRIIEDRIEQKPKGFAYAEFDNVEGLKRALELDGMSFEGRSMRIKIADPPRGDREGRADSGRELDWGTRRGPLAAESNTRQNRPAANLGERRPSQGPADDGKVRELDWGTRRGPLAAAAAPMERQMSGDGGRQRNVDAPRARRQSPVAWGPSEAQQEGSRPPRRDIADKPERVASAAEKDMQWRNSMRPDLAAKSPVRSRDGSEAPSSPAQTIASPAMPPAHNLRPKLNLQKRTVSEATDLLSPASGTDLKASPFGGAKPIDTAAREREIEDKRLQALKEKHEADEKAKEEKRVAKEKEAAAKAEAEAEEKAVAAATAATAATATNATATSSAMVEGEQKQQQQPGETKEMEKAGKKAEETEKAAETADTAEIADTADTAETMEATVSSTAAAPSLESQKSSANPRASREPRENRENRENREPRETLESRDGTSNKPRDGNSTKYQSRATESGNWRQASAGDRGTRAPPSGPRRSGDRNERGSFRGPRGTGHAREHDREHPRTNGSPSTQAPPPSQASEQTAPPTQDEEGWTTVSASNKRRSHSGRPIPS